MHALTRFFIHNPVAANLVMMLILIAGYMSLSSIRIEGFPKVPADTITIQTTFSGAYAAQIDEQITQKIEKAIEGIDGIKNVFANSIDGYSEITIQKTANHKIQKLLDDIRIRVDGIGTLPQKSERPVIQVDDFDFPALYIQLYGQTDSKTLQTLSQRLRKAILARPEISRLKTWGLKSPEILITVAPHELEKHDLSMQDIVEKIQQSSLFFETGTLKTEGGKISLKADQQAYYVTDYAEIPLLKLADGTQIHLGDIAKIEDGYVDDGINVRFNGVDTIGMEILIGRKENLLVISEAIRSVTDDFKQQLPPDVHISIWGDSSHYISERLELLRDNAIEGLLLVVVLLAMFLNVKLALWVSMGIPISIAGTMAIMGTSWVDYSLNDITTFGMIIALGILVDDAVVVGESVYEQRRHTPDPHLGTEKGVEKVATATIFGVLTTVAAFAPMMMINNSMGQVLASFAGVVILALLFSLFESKFILPSHLAEISLDTGRTKYWLSRFWDQIQKRAQNGLQWFCQNIYAPTLRWALRQRYAIVIFFVAAATFGIGLIVNGQIKTVFYPEIPGQVISIKLEMDQRAPKRLLIDNVTRIETIAKSLNQRYKTEWGLEENPIRHILIIINDAASSEIYAELTPPQAREGLGTLDILKKWQTETGVLEGSTSLTFSGSEEMAGGFAIELYSEDVIALQQAGGEIRDYLSGIDGVWNVRDSLKQGKPELQLKLRPEAKHLGFSAEMLAMQIGQRFGGAEAQRIQRNGQEVKVIIKNSAESRRTISDLMQTRLKSNKGHWLPLLSVASIESGYATDKILRKNGKRINSIKAYIDKEIVAPAEVLQGLSTELVPELQKKYPQVTAGVGGELEEMNEMQGGLLQALLIAAIVIYALMAIPLKSYWQPFIIMSVIPFGFVGAAVGHWIMDLPLSLLSFFGMLALAGIVVNDSLVLMTTYNQNRADLDSNASDVVHSSGTSRFQAVFLTTVTTVAGLTPLMMETSEQAQYLIPAAVSLAFGEIFATAITLLLVPTLIAISEDVKRLGKNS